MKVLLKPFQYLSRISKRNAGIIVAAIFFAIIAAFIFREKIPFLASTGDDPIAYWNMDEGTGTTVYDFVSTKNGTLGTGNSAPSWAKDELCVVGKCLQFDGTNDYVNVNDHADFNFSAYTLSLWIKPSGFPTSGKVWSLVNQWGGGGAGLASWIIQYTDAGKITIANHNGSSTCTVTGSSVVAANKWTHITGVYSGGTSGTNALLYINGILDNTGTLTCSTQNSGYPLKIGLPHVAGGTTENYKGLMDEIKVYDYARTADQIKAEYAARGTVRGVASQLGDSDVNKILSDGLAAYWKMDESTWVGNNAVTDSSGNFVGGTSVGGATVSVGKFGNGGLFDGTDDMVSISGLNGQSFPTEGTFALWFKTGDQGGWNNYNALFSGSNALSTVNYFSIQKEGVGNTSPVRVDFGNSGGTYSVLNSTSLFPANSDWIHAAVVWNQSTNKAYLYINGILEASQDVTTWPSQLNVWQFGRDRTYTDRDFRGSIDEVRFYKRAFPAKDIKLLYNFAPGPIGHWKMDDINGSTVVDSSGFLNNGSFGEGDSSPSYVSGKYGKSLQFDGVNDYVNIGDPASSIFDFESGNFSVSAWVNTTQLSTSTWPAVVNKDEGTGGTRTGWELSFQKDTGYPYFGIWSNGSNSAAISTVAYNDGEWHYLVGVRESGVLKLYVNGILITQTNTSLGSVSNAQALFIGKRNLSAAVSYPFSGKIDDVRIYNYARTQSQIMEDMNTGHPVVGTPVGSTVAHYKFDEGYGTTLNDWSIQGNDGTFGTGDSAPSWTNDGKFGKALNFDGSGDYVEVGVGNTAVFSFTNFTISSWINADSFAVGTRIASTYHGSSPSNFYGLTITTGDLPSFSFRDVGGSIVTAIGRNAIITGRWYHIAGVRDAGSTGKIYVNGVEVGSTADTTGGVIIGPHRHISIGWDPARSSGLSFDGKIDEFKIYPVALTSEQVKTEYNQGKAIVLGSTSTGVGGTAPDNSTSRAYCVPGDSGTCAPPIGEWKFDSKSGTTAYDTSTNGYTGILGAGNSAPVWSKGKMGNSLDFDGDNDYVELGDIAAIDNADDLSLCAWVKPATDTTDDYIFAKYNSGTDTGIQFLRDNVGATSGRTDIFKIRIGQPGGNDAELETSTDSAPAGTWTHVCFTFVPGSSTGLRVYVNGMQDAFSPASTSLVTSIDADTLSATIGSINGGNFFDGNIDNVRIFDYVLTPAQIAWEYNRGAPIAYYKLDECSGTTAYDYSQSADTGFNGKNGIIHTGSTGSQTSAGTCSSGNTAHAWNNGTTGKYGASLNFDGTNDYIEIPHSAALDMTDQITVSTWIKIQDNADRNILGKWLTTGNQRSYMLLYDAPNLQFAVSDNGSFSAANQLGDIDLTPYVGTWTHITATWNAGDLRLYINGGERFRGTTNATTLFNSTATFRIGDVQTGGVLTQFRGQIDEVKVFDYALTPAQVKTEMNAGAVRFN